MMVMKKIQGYIPEMQEERNVDWLNQMMSLFMNHIRCDMQKIEWCIERRRSSSKKLHSGVANSVQIVGFCHCLVYCTPTPYANTLIESFGFMINTH